MNTIANDDTISSFSVTCCPCFNCDSNVPHEHRRCNNDPVKPVMLNWDLNKPAQGELTNEEYQELLNKPLGLVGLLGDFVPPIGVKCIKCKIPFFTTDSSEFRSKLHSRCQIRPSWDEYYLGIADAVSKRASCPRLSVGVIIVKSHNILASGYNGSPTGEPNCLNYGCKIVDGHCSSVIHGELNSILSAAKHGVSIEDATMYLTFSPCWECAKHIVQVGIKRVVFRDVYRFNQDVPDLFKRHNIEYVQQKTSNNSS